LLPFPNERKLTERTKRCADVAHFCVLLVILHRQNKTIPTMPRPTEQQKLGKRVMARMLKAIRQYALINDGDRILVGLSGGKDSLCLVDLLAERMKILKPKFHVEALHVRMENIRYESDATYLRQFCESRGVEFHLLTTRFDASTDTRKSPCFLCSWNRRKQLFDFAQAEGFNKIALGHHLDDIIHTAMMNLFFEGSFSTMPARLKMRKMPLTIIRPLCMVSETDLRLYAQMNEFKKQTKLCPYEANSFRGDMRDIFERIEKIAPDARHSVWNALHKCGKLTE